VLHDPASARRLLAQTKPLGDGDESVASGLDCVDEVAQSIAVESGMVFRIRAHVHQHDFPGLQMREHARGHVASALPRRAFAPLKPEVRLPFLGLFSGRRNSTRSR
jgi:hypothetical protein